MAGAVAGSFALFAATAAFGQGTPPPVPDYQQMMADYEAATAAAHRPGDENLGCEALKSELTAVVNDPDLKAYIETAGAAAQRDMAIMQNAQSALVTGVPVAPLPSPPVSAADRVQEQALQLEQLNALMPKLLRAQRVNELAVLQACDWLGEGIMPGMDMPGMTMPGIENPGTPAE
jgi:hypothetical protein